MNNQKLKAMKTIICSLTLLLVFLTGTANAQILHFYWASKHPITQPVKETATAINLRVNQPMIAVKNADLSNIIPEKQTAKYISPLGFLLKPTNTNGLNNSHAKQGRRTAGVK
jgi:hypothetical protein